MAHGMVQQGMAWCGMVWHGMAWNMAHSCVGWHGMVGLETSVGVGLEASVGGTSQQGRPCVISTTT